VAHSLDPLNSTSMRDRDPRNQQSLDSTGGDEEPRIVLVPRSQPGDLPSASGNVAELLLRWRSALAIVAAAAATFGEGRRICQI